MTWKEGTGRKIGGVFIVADEEGRAFANFSNGAVFGHGNNRVRVIANAHGGLDVVFDDRDLRGPEPLIVLTDGLKGWWWADSKKRDVAHFFKAKASGFNVPIPVPTLLMPAEPVRPEIMPAAADTVWRELPEAARDLVRDTHENYYVFKGTGRVVALARRSPLGTVITPDDRPKYYGEYLHAYRGPLFRALRDDKRTKPLVEVPLTRLPEGYVHDQQRTAQSGWYWHEPGREPRFITGRRRAIRLDISDVPSHCRRQLAHNGIASPAIGVEGFVEGGDFAYPRVNRGPTTKLLIDCPPGSARTFVVVTRTNGLNVIGFTVTHHMGGGYAFLPADSPPRCPYIVLTDNKGRPRVFQNPL